MMRKIVLVGGSGYIGSVLASYFKTTADEIVIVSRSPRPAFENIRTVTWNGRDDGDWSNALAGSDLVINLTGKNVNCRYTEKNKHEILASRIDSVNILGKVIQRLSNPPALWIQLASATIYRHAEDHFMDEDTGEPGRGFSVDVCKAWEEAFWNQSTPRTRKILFRTSIVLGKSGGALPQLVAMTKAGLGGKQGNGEQYISWIHERDLCAMVDWFYNHPELSGTVNCTSPGPVKNALFMKELRSATAVPLGIPTPAWLLGVGAAIIGTETELILKSRWVMPSRMLKEGFVFEFDNLRSALSDIVS